MRMRVTKPDFWESEDIGNLSVFGRLLLKAVWSYVDDNGVQKDSPVGIAGECFRYDLARDPAGTIKQIESRPRRTVRGRSCLPAHARARAPELFRKG